jgi:hypothetical protein
MARSQPQQIFCANCRGGNPPGAQRCMWCGQPLPSRSQRSGLRRLPWWVYAVIGLCLCGGLAGITQGPRTNDKVTEVLAFTTNTPRPKATPATPKPKATPILSQKNAQATARIGTAMVTTTAVISATSTVEALVQPATSTPVAPIPTDTAVPVVVAPTDTRPAPAPTKTKARPPTATKAPIPVQQSIPGCTGSGARYGAICKDGTRSTATGRGACSHHGGVREWLICP